jgi:fructose-bisphosphate aldolase class II
MIVTTAQLFKHAYGKYAVGAYNINNAEQAMGLFKGAIQSKAPFIIQISKGARYTDKRMLEAVIRAAGAIFPEAIFAVHLDHGDEQTCYDCIDSGFFSSVMIDASHDPFEKNVEITKRVVDARPRQGHLSVEAELGMLGGVEEDIKVDDGHAMLTNPVEAEVCEADRLRQSRRAPSAPRTAPSSSRANRGCTSTCSRRSRPSCPASRWSCTARPPCRRTR